MAIRWAKYNTQCREDCKPVVKYLKDNGLISSTDNITLYPGRRSFSSDSANYYNITDMSTGNNTIGVQHNYPYSHGYKLPNSKIYATEISRLSLSRGKYYRFTTYIWASGVSFEGRYVVSELRVRKREL